MSNACEFLESGSENEVETEVKPKTPTYSPGTFNWGKYKNRKIEDILKEDESYCKWFLDNVDDGSKHKQYVKCLLSKHFEI